MKTLRWNSLFFVLGNSTEANNYIIESILIKNRLVIYFIKSLSALQGVSIP